MLDDIFEKIRKAMEGKDGFAGILKVVQDDVPDDEVAEKTWVQVGKLTQEDEGRRRSLTAKTDAAKREHDVLLKKDRAIIAQVEADSEEWWNHIHKTYGLTAGKHHLHDDGRIFRKPDEK